MALTQTEVSELYVAIFNRASEGEGNKYWQTNQPDMVTTANVMLATDAAKSYFGSSLDTAQAFIEHIYKNTLNKTVTDDPDGIAYWVNELSTKSRGEVVVALINAAKLPENKGDAQDQFNNRVAVSNHMADTVETAPADYATSTVFATSGTTGLVVTNDSATVTSADAAIDALANPAIALTVDPDTLTDQLTTGDDTIDASTVLDSLNGGDIIIDNSTTDNDTLNAKITAQTTPIAPTIVNIENINLDLQGMSDVTYDATSTTNANITLLSTQFGFGGKGIVTGLKNGTTVTAGDKIENLDITTSAATDTATVVLSGDVTDLAIKTATSASISATADATVTLTQDATPQLTTTTITGDKSVTLKVAGAGVTAKTVTSELTAGEAKIHLTDATDVDATKFTVDSIVLGADGAQTISIVDGATVEVGVAQTNTVTIDNGTAAGAYTANIKTGVNISALDVSDADLSTNLELTANSEIATLTSTDNNVTVTGTGNLNISTTINADKLDASALNGKLDITANGSDIAVLGGTGAATIAFAAGYDASFVGLDGGSTITSAIASGNTLSVQTGSGVDTLEQTASIAGLTLNAQLGAGDDVIKLTDTAATAANATTKIAIDMGAGNDTLELVDTLDLSAAGKLELVGLETIQLTDAATDGASATFAASQLDGLTSTIKGTSVAYAQDTNSPQTLTLNDDTGDILNVSLSATDTGVDLSTLTLDAVEIVKINQPSTALTADLTIKGTATRDMITGGDGNDTIIAGEGQDEITGGKGNDTIDLTETQVEIGKDIVNLSAVADNGVDTIKAFAAGDGADIITIKGVDTAAVGGGPGGNATIIGSTTGLVTDGAAWDISGTTDARDILEVTTTLDSTVSFTADSTGHDLLQALSSDTTEASEITLDSGVDQFLVAYQDGNAYLWHLDGTDASVTADEIQLVAILENVSSGTVDTGDFVLA